MAAIRIWFTFVESNKYTTCEACVIGLEDEALGVGKASAARFRVGEKTLVRALRFFVFVLAYLY